MSVTHDLRETNQRAAQQIFAVWDGGDADALDDIVAEDLVFHTPTFSREPALGRDAYKGNLRMVRAGFPDLFFRANDIVADDELVMAYCTFGGTHTGTILGIEPTGASVEVAFFGSYRFDDGRLVEVTSLPDLCGLFLQLGVIEPPGRAEAK